MSREAEFTKVAAALGHPTRAAMLSALLGGEAMAAGALARVSGVTPATASGHLAQLCAAGLTVRYRSGREVRYALAGPLVAGALESLARLGRAHVAGAAGAPPLRYARSCYDHLAGRLGIAITDAIRERGFVTRRNWSLTPAGAEWLTSVGIDVSALRSRRRPLTRRCLDWTERRDHLAGAVAAALLSLMLERRWLARFPDSRALRLSVRGSDGLYRILGLELTP